MPLGRQRDSATAARRNSCPRGQRSPQKAEVEQHQTGYGPVAGKHPAWPVRPGNPVPCLTMAEDRPSRDGSPWEENLVRTTVEGSQMQVGEVLMLL